MTPETPQENFRPSQNYGDRLGDRLEQTPNGSHLSLAYRDWETDRKSVV